MNVERKKKEIKKKVDYKKYFMLNKLKSSFLLKIKILDYVSVFDFIIRTIYFTNQLPTLKATIAVVVVVL